MANPCPAMAAALHKDTAVTVQDLTRTSVSHCMKPQLVTSVHLHDVGHLHSIIVYR